MFKTVYSFSDDQRLFESFKGVVEATLEMGFEGYFEYYDDGEWNKIPLKNDEHTLRKLSRYYPKVTSDIQDSRMFFNSNFGEDSDFSIFASPLFP